MSKFYYIETWGCQMNEEDSEKLSGMLTNLGYAKCLKREDSDIIIFNTCCVRENAELKVYGNLGELKGLKKKKQDLIIAVCGCMMQQKGIAEKIIKKYPFVDIIFGTHNAHKFPEYLNRTLCEGKSIVEVFDKEEKIVEGIAVDRMSLVKAFVTIMYGCNNFCTYCIVPYVRGRERSRSVDNILNEVRDLANKGYKEITLLGQNVNSYGKDLLDRTSFASLIDKIAKIEGILRIRFMTSHPKDLTDDVIDAILNNPKICNHIHLPIQSGSSKILKKMNRGYTREEYLNLIKKIKDKIPDIALTTDIIVGFPGEDEEDIEETISLCKEVMFDSAYTFIYSKREGTPSANFHDDIDDETKHKRFNKVVLALNETALSNNKKCLNKVYDVLVEDLSKNNIEKLSGRTEGGKLVNFSGREDMIGKMVKVRITDVRTHSLVGEVL